MHKYPLSEILERIRHEEVFEGEIRDGSFYIKIEEYLPVVCVANHDGHNFRPELKEKCALSEDERWYEEDPQTGRFIAPMPITLIGRDSRYEYDLNRKPDECIYDTAWGKEVWTARLTAQERKTSLRKHQNYYRVAEALIGKLVQKYGGCLAYDIHSYNYKRYSHKTPLFNLGLKNIDMARFGRAVERWSDELVKFEPGDGTEVRVAYSEMFQGNGYFLRRMTELYPKCLVLATEIKKIYCNEQSGDLYPEMISRVSEHYKQSMLNHAKYFIGNHTNYKINKKYKLLSTDLTENILRADKALFQLTRNFELLQQINPVNTESEKRKFFSSRYSRNPEFRYRQLSIDPFRFKQQLYQVPVEKIRDDNIQRLYKDAVMSYANKADMLASIGTEKFLYNSLRYFGEPGKCDLQNAEYIMHSPEVENGTDDKAMTAEETAVYMRRVANDYGFDCKVELSGKLVAKALVISNKKTLQLRRNATFSRGEAEALSHHEIGTHMLTTINANAQPLRILRVGLPGNSFTQEGLAVLSEYLSGQFSVARLKELALRILAINHMLKENDFRQTFFYLTEGHHMQRDKAFYLCARVFRGGGFTKDYVYLKGFTEMLQYWRKGMKLDNLLTGKTSVAYLGTINEMVERGFLIKPRQITHTLEKPVQGKAELEYMLRGLK